MNSVLETIGFENAEEREDIIESLLGNVDAFRTLSEMDMCNWQRNSHREQKQAQGFF